MRFQARTLWYAVRVRGVSVIDSKDRERVRELVDGVGVVLSVLGSRSKESITKDYPYQGLSICRPLALEIHTSGVGEYQ